ncbi:putative N-acetyltransferase YoaA-like [Senna tora]|uniref:Putative N-acetyltransferase YoaA-like n=1 Tax=Senna tora TaxID=362788 RepID=A0A834W9I1_9FABA|nr:putative N-acetyltransferase YoaA-like [Senna tora]
MDFFWFLISASKRSFPDAIAAMYSLAVSSRLQRRRSSLAVDVSSMASLYLHKRPLHQCRSVSPFSGDDKCRVELRYAIAAMYWGHGVTTEAVKMTVFILTPVFNGEDANGPVMLSDLILQQTN